MHKKYSELKGASNRLLIMKSPKPSSICRNSHSHAGKGIKLATKNKKLENDKLFALGNSYKISKQNCEVFH